MPAEKPSKVSWADLLSDDSNSFRAPPAIPADSTKVVSPPPAASAAAKKTAAAPRRKFRAVRGLPVNAEDSYRAPVEENSRNSLNAEIAGFGLWLPKGGVEVEDSNTQGISNKRPISEVQMAADDQQPPSKRPRGQFPVDPVFGGEMTTRGTLATNQKKK